MIFLEDWWIPRERVGLFSSDMIFKKIKLTVFAVYTHYFFLEGHNPTPSKDIGNVWEEILTGTILKWCYLHLVAGAKDTNWPGPGSNYVLLGNTELEISFCWG